MKAKSLTNEVQVTAVPSMGGGNFTLEAAARQYIELKAESENIAKRMEGLRKMIVPTLEHSDERSVTVDDQELFLVECTKETFDLEGAKKKKPLALKLKPYVEVIEKLDLKAAKKHLPVALLRPFITASEYFQLRVREKKNDETGGLFSPGGE